MPGLAFTEKGHRMGYGGGFYDKFLSQEPNHPTLALCYAFQMVDELPVEEYDVPVDVVLWA
jgi:5-formyltetrahydrofolate cyclo-ligase